MSEQPSDVSILSWILIAVSLAALVILVVLALLVLSMTVTGFLMG